MANDSSFEKPARGLTRALASRSRARRDGLRAAVATAPLPSYRNDPAPALECELRLIATLRSPKRRVRKVESAHLSEVRRSIETLGFSDPVLIARDGEIIDGQVRVEAARQLGIEKVPCVIIDHLSFEHRRLLRVTVNRGPGRAQARIRIASRAGDAVGHHRVRAGRNRSRPGT